jgi:hypothetical protein
MKKQHPAWRHSAGLDAVDIGGVVAPPQERAFLTTPGAGIFITRDAGIGQSAILYGG